MATWVPGGSLVVQGGNVGIGTNGTPDKLNVNGSIYFAGNLAGGTTGNVGIGTGLTAAGATCDTICNNAGKRCFFGVKTASVSLADCSTSIIGDCACLPPT